ncbi:MAG: DNA primase [Fimbriimonas sp.]|nr:DNA primase [Fimbriimonas sp.]
MNDDRDEIRRRIDLVDLVSQRVRLKRSGKNYTGLCPFHDDKSPSFYVNPALGRYTCFSCGEKGDVFTWTMKTQGLEFREALQLLADQAGVKLTSYSGPTQDKSEREGWLATMQSALIFYRNELGKSSTAKTYCDNRDIPQSVIDEWELGYAPSVREGLVSQLKRDGHQLVEAERLFLVQGDQQNGYTDKFFGRLMFPIRDDRGDLVGFGGRVLGDGTPKYINSSDTPLYRKSRVLYGFHKARDRMMKERHAVLVEGYLDVIACHRAGVKEAVASLGTSLAEDHAKLLKRFCDKVTILYDADKAGEKAAMRAVEILGEVGLQCRIALMPQGEDPDTLLRQKGAEAVQEAVTKAESPFDFEIRLLESRLGILSDEFWEQIPLVLAKAITELDLERHILRLAGQHPAIPNAQSAAAALRREVNKHRRAAQKGIKNEELPAAPKIKRSASSLQKAEQILLVVWLEPERRPLIKPLIEEQELWQTGTARLLVLALKEASEFDELPEDLQAILLEIDASIPQQERTDEVIKSAEMLLRIELLTTQIRAEEEVLLADPNNQVAAQKRKELTAKRNSLKTHRTGRGN